MLYVRGFLTWLLMMAIETISGTVRVLLLEPRLGVGVARAIAFPIGCVVVLGTAWLLLPWIAPRSRRSRLLLGVGWVALTVAFEFAMGVLQGLSLVDILAEYDLTRGRLMAIGLVVLLVAPWVRPAASA